MKRLANLPSLPISRLNWARWGRYLVLGILANVGIWGMTIVYLKKTPPTYTSELSFILPGGTSGASINLPEIGQASSSSGSAFNSSSSDPRENYKYVATSDPVLKAAAKAVGLTTQVFGKPRIKLVNNSHIMEVQINGKSPEQAQQKGFALYQALVKRLDWLRAGETKGRDQVTQASLRAAQTKLSEAQRRFSDYKSQSGLSSPDQIKNLLVNIEQLRKQKVEIFAQQKQTSSRLQGLSTDLGLSPQEAADAFVLHADPAFQQNLKSYSEASATLAVFQSKWGVSHPMVIRETARQEAASQALLKRGSLLLRRSLDQKTLIRLNLDSSGSSGARSNLLQGLVSLKSDQAGLTTQVQALSQAIAQLEKRLKDLTKKESMFDRLNRDVQIAEAVFASTL
ncbi:MAG: hypothetical protein VKJ46_14035, partial [Leptolyngbyaceae bacterium]|nr:hypothetical protein [Leptolyngbyaceae bacterium]